MDEELPTWVREGFDRAVGELQALPSAGTDPAQCAHLMVLPLGRHVWGVASRRTIRFGRCVACLGSVRLCGAA